MPSDNNSQIPAARVQLWDNITNFVSRPWYRWFFNIYTAIEAGRRYGSFYDTTTQTIAAINTAYAITYNSTATKTNDGPMQYGVYIGTPASRIYVDNTANYNIQFSLQLSSSSAAAKNVYIWLRINGVDVPDSATVITIAGNNVATVAAWNFVVNLTAGSYFELMWAADNTNVTIKSSTASPPRPGIPGVILTVTSIVGA